MLAMVVAATAVTIMPASEVRDVVGPCPREDCSHCVELQGDLRQGTDGLAGGLRDPAVWSDATITKVFTHDEVEECVRIRTPYLETSGDDHYHIWAICCGDNACGHKVRRANRRLLDDHKDARVIMKTSTDRGATWGKTKYITDKGYANAKAIFDSARNTLVVQYSKNNEAVYQITSVDHGESWSDQHEIKEATECGGGGVGGGGSRTITKTGRMLWYSDSPGCIWYSDDGGKTYKTEEVHGEKGQKLENEVSFAALSSGSIYANGRSMNKDWAPNRMDFKSFDDGIHWTVRKSELVDPTSQGEIRQTARGLVAGSVNKAHNISTLYSSEPAGTSEGARSKLVVSCSLDGGRTWPHSIGVNGDKRAEYSALLYHSGHLVVAWGWNDNFEHTVGEQVLSTVIPIHWCEGA